MQKKENAVVIDKAVSGDENSETNSIKEEYGSLSQELRPWVVSLLTLGSAVGTGLIIGSGSALVKGGPISIFIAYLFTGSLLCVVIFSLSEMASFSPMDKGFSGYLNKYVDPAFGFAAGWNYFLKYAIVLSANLSAFGLVIEYWRPDVNVGVWVTVLYASVFCANLLAVEYFGKIEAWLTVFKLLVLIIVYIVCLVITCGGAPNHTTIGFRYWRENGTLPYLIGGNAGKFLGWWACVVQSIFGFMGSEMVGIVYGETANPKKTIPKSSLNVLFRIGFLYIFGVFILGLTISPLNSRLVQAHSTDANASPFVIAISSSGIKVLPGFVNAALLVFIISSANTDIYICSRQLYGLAKDRAAPKVFLFTNKSKVPLVGCIVGSLLGLLAYMSTNKATATVFNYMTSTVSVFGVLNWFYILIAYINYDRAIKKQGINFDEIPFRMWFQPYAAYMALFFVVIITFFNGYNAFIIQFHYKNFITSYIGIFANILMVIGYKVYFKTKFVQPSEIIFEKREEFEREEV